VAVPAVGSWVKTRVAEGEVVAVAVAEKDAVDLEGNLQEEGHDEQGELEARTPAQTGNDKYLVGCAMGGASSGAAAAGES